MGTIRTKVWKSETITFLGLLAVILVSCTQPRALKQAKQYEARRDYSSAYSNVVAALETSPNNKRLLQERLRMGNLYSLEILRQQSLFATNNLYERIQLLQTGLSLDSTNKNSIDALFKDLSSRRTRLLSQAANLQTNQSVDLILTEVEKLSAYCLADSELRMASVGNRMLAEHAAALVRRTADAGEVRFARQLALRGERVFVDDGIKQIRKQLENELRTACLNSIIPPLSNEASLGSRTFVAWAKTLLSPLNEDFLNEYVSLQRALKESSLPVAQVLLSGEISSDQESALRATINARAQKAGCRIATAAYTNPPDVVISIIIKDAAYKPSSASRNVYSKYEAGVTQEPNPMYDRVSVQYQQALEAARSAEVNAAVNGGLIPNIMAGKARRNANDVAALLASTPRFNDVKIYRDYQFTETDIVLDCRLHSEIQAFDGITRDLLCTKSVTGGQKYSFTTKAEVHPSDSKGNANKGLPEKWATDRFEDFFTENITQISDKAAGVYTESVAKLVANYVAKSQKSLAAEVALAGALPADASKASRSDWLSDKRISGMHEQIDRSSFEPGAAGSLPSWSEIRDALMHFAAARISGTNVVLKSDLASIDPIQLKLSETQFPHPSEDASIQLAKLSGQHRPQVSASIRAAMDSTVTLLTDVGSGSGFVVSTNGYIVTNDHVIEGANKVLVASADGRRISAEVVERNTARDLAVLRVKEGAWQPLPIGDIDNLAIGSTVTAIGSPGGLNGAVLEQTVTRGVVSGIRAFASDSNPNIKIEYVQTDAAINRGNSGGPLINEAGQVVGINTQKIVGKGVDGLNFSISISEVKKLFYRYLD